MPLLGIRQNSSEKLTDWVLKQGLFDSNSVFMRELPHCGIRVERHHSRLACP